MLRPPPRSAVPPRQMSLTPEERLSALESAAVQSDDLNSSGDDSRRGFASLALASGTGEDVAALTPLGPRTRWFLNGRALKTVGMAMLVALAATWMWLATQTSSTVALSDEGSLPEPSTATSTVVATESASAAATIVAYISGAVESPGVYSGPTDSRVNDFVELAGGLAPSADPNAINLAAPVADGAHIHVPEVGEAVSSQAGSGDVEGGSGGSELVNINSADAATLQTLPGIGPSLSTAIIEWRQTNGPFGSVEDLLAVSGIGEATLAKFRDLVTV